MTRLKEQAIAFYSALTVLVAVQATVVHSAMAAGSDFARPVKIGGDRKMYLECRGTGSPTVVFVSGLKGSAEDWKISTNQSEPAVFGEVSKITRACAYDRPGTPVGEKPSRSDPAPQPTTARMRSPICMPF
jgi:hypothetical protein